MKLLPQDPICLVVAAADFKSFMRQLRTAQSQVGRIELRIDTLVDVSVTHLQRIAQCLTAKAIVTCRSQQHGGCFTGSPLEQQRLLQAANDLGFDYVDVDVALSDQINIQNRRCQLIVSYHHFTETPEIDVLNRVHHQMQQASADILKFATYCRSVTDARRLLAFLLAKPADERRIVLGMGQAGKITRLLSPLLGGYLTFATLGKTDHNLGYLSYKVLRAFFKLT